MSAIRKGDMVACILGWPPDRIRNRANVPVVGGVYTVRAAEPYPDGIAGLLLEEIVNPPQQFDVGGYGEGTFAASHFRKIKKPDIGALRDLMAKARSSAKRKKATPAKRAKVPAREGV